MFKTREKVTIVTLPSDANFAARSLRFSDRNEVLTWAPWSMRLL